MTKAVRQAIAAIVGLSIAILMTINGSNIFIALVIGGFSSFFVDDFIDEPAFSCVQLANGALHLWLAFGVFHIYRWPVLLFLFSFIPGVFSFYKTTIEIKGWLNRKGIR